MMNKVALLLLAILWASNVQAQNYRAKIIASSVPLAGIIQMVAGNDFEVTAINIENGCPHHYHAKPSDKLNIESSDIAVYVDENFDGFFASILKNFSGTIFKVSNIKQIDFNGAGGKKNWHFWLDLQNVKFLLNHFAQDLIGKYPDLAANIKGNVKIAEDRLDELQKQKTISMGKMPKFILLSNSVEHFFRRDDYNYKPLFQTDYPSLQFAKELDSVLAADNDHCVVIDLHQTKSSFKKFGKKIVQLNAENWYLEKDMNYAEVFYLFYGQLAEKMQGCRN